MSNNNSLILISQETPGDRLLCAITEKSMTQRKFAELIGMSPNGLNSIIKGQKRLSRVLAIAAERLTGVRADWILNHEPPQSLNPYNEIDPWARLILEYFKDAHEEVHEMVFRELESKTSSLKHGLDKNKLWTEEDKKRFEELLAEIRRFIDFYFESEDGWAPNMYIYLVMSFRFEKLELDDSWVGRESGASKSPTMKRVWEIKDEMGVLINKFN